MDRSILRLRGLHCISQSDTSVQIYVSIQLLITLHGSQVLEVRVLVRVIPVHTMPHHVAQ